jgi:hypothetical protein
VHIAQKGDFAPRRGATGRTCGPAAAAVFAYCPLGPTAVPLHRDLPHALDRLRWQKEIEITSLEGARSPLTLNGAAPDNPCTAVSSPKTKRRRRRTKARKPLTADAADQLVANGDGLTIAALAERAGAGREQVLASLCELEQAQRVRRIGQRRATRWRARATGWTIR